MKNVIRIGRTRRIGATSWEQVLVVASVGLIGIGGFAAFGRGMENDIAGQGAPAAIVTGPASQAANTENPGGADTSTPPVVAVQPGSSEHRQPKDSAHLRIKLPGGVEVGAGGGWLSSLGGFLGDVAGGVRDAGSWFVNTPFARSIGGFVDGAWDALYGTAKGLLTAVWRVGWDFLVEDVLVGNLRGLAGLGCKLVTLGQACEDSSWNPYKQTTDSVLNFVKKIPEARHAVGDALHEASLCLNPWNGQAAEDRGHACGQTFVAIADIVVGAKGLGKGGAAIKGASKVDDLADAARIADDIPVKRPPRARTPKDPNAPPRLDLGEPWEQLPRYTDRVPVRSGRYVAEGDQVFVELASGARTPARVVSVEPHLVVELPGAGGSVVRTTVDPYAVYHAADAPPMTESLAEQVTRNLDGVRSEDLPVRRPPRARTPKDPDAAPRMDLGEPWESRPIHTDAVPVRSGGYARVGDQVTVQLQSGASTPARVVQVNGDGLGSVHVAIPGPGGTERIVRVDPYAL